MEPKSTPKNIPIGDEEPADAAEAPVEGQNLSVNGIDLSESLGSPDQTSKRSKEPKKPKKGLKYIIKEHKVAFVVILLLVAAGVTALVIFLLNLGKDQAEPAAKQEAEAVHYYSKLSGEEIASEDLNKLPTFCMQVPNGMDSPRPQTGLAHAPVVFEAIAEAGITRFAAIFQGIDDSAVGPIRSLRPYYLQWDTPFDCTVVHAGGSDEALADLKSGNYRDLTENNTYMWRDNGAGYNRPNNLFTSAELLNKFNSDKGYNSSDVKGFPRLKPAEAAEKSKANAAAAEPLTEAEKQESASADSENKTREVVPLVTNIEVNFGRVANYNIRYTYNAETNSYARAYANGQAHTTFTCPAGLKNPHPQKDCGEAAQLAPKVVVAMEVEQSLARDRYHVDTTTTGTGKAHIFQNGQVIPATWSKKDVGSQIEFKDGDGNVISFTPGQMWISAIPTSGGSVKY